MKQVSQSPTSETHHLATLISPVLSIGIVVLRTDGRGTMVVGLGTVEVDEVVIVADSYVKNDMNKVGQGNS